MSKKPPQPEGSRFEVSGNAQGPFQLPDLYRFEALSPAGLEGWVVAELWTLNDTKKLYLPISYLAAERLVAENAEVLQLGRRIVTALDPFDMEDPVEAPPLQSFLGFLGIDSDWFVLSFLEENGKEVFFSVSTKAYNQLLSTLKVLLPRIH